MQHDTTQAIVKHTLSFTRSDLIELFGGHSTRAHGMVHALDQLTIPVTAVVSVNVPGGGDDSNTDLVLSEDVVLSVSWNGPA